MVGGRTFARFAQLPLVRCPPGTRRGCHSVGRAVPHVPRPFCAHHSVPLLPSSLSTPAPRPPSALCTCESAAVSPAGLPCAGPSSQTHPLAPSPGGLWAHRGQLREAGGGLGEGLGAQRGEVTTLTGASG